MEFILDNLQKYLLFFTFINSSTPSICCIELSANVAVLFAKEEPRGNQHSPKYLKLHWHLYPKVSFVTVDCFYKYCL